MSNEDLLDKTEAFVKTFWKSTPKWDNIGDSGVAAWANFRDDHRYISIRLSGMSGVEYTINQSSSYDEKELLICYAILELAYEKITKAGVKPVKR